jgi:hypothetical protein
VVSLDAALTYLPHAADGRVILKVDAEGFEPQVIAGARNLLRSGRVALIIWERGNAFGDGAERQAMFAMVEALSRQGFRHFRPPDQERDGPLAAFRAEDAYIGNVFSFGPHLQLPSAS